MLDDVQQAVLAPLSANEKKTFVRLLANLTWPDRAGITVNGMKPGSDSSNARRARSAWRDLVAVLWTAAFLACLLVPGSISFLADLPAPVLVALAVAGLISIRRVAVKAVAYGRVIPRARRNRLDLVKNLGRRPALGLAVLTYEVGAFVSSSVNHRLKYLASVKVSSRIGCPF